jgi:protein-tyrosine phosphatase
VRILFVCLGNICRSPSAEAVMRELLAETGLEREVEVDSAGTGDWHVGSPPDRRAVAAARDRGIELAGTARAVAEADFERFDLIVAMDHANLGELRRRARGPGQEAKLRLLREYDPAAPGAEQLEVPDPYFGDGDGFELVLDILERSCRNLLEELDREA